MNHITSEYLTCSPSTITHVVHALNQGYLTSDFGHNPVASDEVRAAVKAFKQSYSPAVDGVASGVPADDNADFAALDSLKHLADSTRQTRTSDWRKWSQWCTTHQVDPLDASPHQIASYLTEEAADGFKVNILQQRWQAIIQVYDVIAPDRANPARHMLVKQTMKGIRRQKRDEQDSQMTAVTAEDFARIQATARRPWPWEDERQAIVRGTTDLAIIGLMRDGLLRVSEAADLTWKDLEEIGDGSGRLTIRYSKTDQEGEGAVVFVSRQTMGWLMEMREIVIEGPTIFSIGKEAIRRHIARRTPCWPERSLRRPHFKDRHGPGLGRGRREVA